MSNGKTIGNIGGYLLFASIGILLLLVGDVIAGATLGLFIWYLLNKAVRANKRVEAEKLLSIVEISGGVCHELSQPMQCIQGAADIIKIVSSKCFCKCGCGARIEETMQILQGGMDRSKTVLVRMNSLNRYATKAHMRGKVIDISSSSDVIVEKNA